MSGCKLCLFGVQPLAFTGPGRNLAPPAVAADAIDRLPDDGPSWAMELERLYPMRSFIHQRLACDGVTEAVGLRFRLSAWLCSNTALNQHVVLFELSCEDVVADGMDVGGLRAMLVAGRDDRRPPAVRGAISQACKRVAALVGGSPEDVVVAEDTCNTTLFLNPCTPADQPLETKVDVFTHDAERLTVSRTLIKVSDDTRVFFGGRVHLVISTSDGDVGVIKQILFMLQVMWFYVPLYLRRAAVLHRRIVADRVGDLDELETVAARLVYASQTVRLQNESAKISYEALTPLVYQPAEAQWAVERSIGQLERYAVFFREFIRDLRETRAAKADEILNYVLAALGLFGIVGLWANVLGAAASAHELASFRNLARIASTSPLGIATVVCIVLSALVAVWLVVYGIRVRHGGSGGRRRARKPARTGSG